MSDILKLLKRSVCNFTLASFTAFFKYSIAVENVCNSNWYHEVHAIFLYYNDDDVDSKIMIGIGSKFYIMIYCSDVLIYQNFSHFLA